MIDNHFSEDELDTRHLLELVDEQFSSDEAEGDVNLIFNQGEDCILDLVDLITSSPNSPYFDDPLPISSPCKGLIPTGYVVILKHS